MNMSPGRGLFWTGCEVFSQRQEKRLARSVKTLYSPYIDEAPACCRRVETNRPTTRTHRENSLCTDNQPTRSSGSEWYVVPGGHDVDFHRLASGEVTKRLAWGIPAREQARTGWGQCVAAHPPSSKEQAPNGARTSSRSPGLFAFESSNRVERGSSAKRVRRARRERRTQAAWRWSGCRSLTIQRSTHVWFWSGCGLQYAGVAQLVVRNVANVEAASSSLAVCSNPIRVCPCTSIGSPMSMCTAGATVCSDGHGKPFASRVGTAELDINRGVGKW